MPDFKIGDWVYAEDWCYGQIVDLHSSWAVVEFNTETGGGSFSFKLSELQKATPLKSISIRDNMLVTAGARAAYMDMKGEIDIPGGLEGEDKLAEVVIEIVDDYLNYDYDPFDIYVENRLRYEFGKKPLPPNHAMYDDETIKWFQKYPGAQTTVARCDKCGLYFKSNFTHKCKKRV